MSDIGAIDTKEFDYVGIKNATYVYQDKFWVPIDSVVTKSFKGSINFQLDKMLTGATQEEDVNSLNTLIAINKSNPTDIQVFGSDDDGFYRFRSVLASNEYYLVSIPTLNSGLKPDAQGPFIPETNVRSFPVNEDITQANLGYLTADVDPQYDNVTSLSNVNETETDQIEDRRSVIWTPTDVVFSTSNIMSGRNANIDFNGTSSYISTERSPNFGFGSGDFTIEFWVYPTVATGDRIIFDNRLDSDVGIGIYTSLNVSSGALAVSNNVDVLDFGGSIPINQWSHIMVSRSSGTIYGFIDGALIFSVTDARTYSTKSKARIGANSGLSGGTPSGQYYQGLIGGWRVTKNLARETSSFTVDTEPFPFTYEDRDIHLSDVKSLLEFEGTDGATTTTDLLGHTWTFNGNAQIDTAEYKTGSSSLKMDGTGDYIVADTSLLDNSIFTAEAWIKLNALNVRQTIFSQYAVGQSNRTILGVYDDNKLRIFNGDNGQVLSNETLSSGVWYHVAFVSDGLGNCYGFLDGVLVATHTNFAVPYNNNTTIGRINAGGSDEFFNGWIDSVRVTHHGRYGPIFDSPVAPNRFYTHEHKSKIVSHLKFNGPDASTDIEDLTGNIWTVNGNAQLDTAQYFHGGSSLYCDGTDDYITTPDSTDLRLGSSDFTIRCKFRLAALSDISLINKWDNGAGNREFVFYILSTGGIKFSISTNGTSQTDLIVSGTSLVTTNVWYDLEISRTGSTIYLFLDGVLVGSDSSNPTIYGGTHKLGIGRDTSISYAPLNGWVDEFQFIKGIGLHSNDFIPIPKLYPTK